MRIYIFITIFSKTSYDMHFVKHLLLWFGHLWSASEWKINLLCIIQMFRAPNFHIIQTHTPHCKPSVDYQRLQRKFIWPNIQYICISIGCHHRLCRRMGKNHVVMALVEVVGSISTSMLSNASNLQQKEINK